MNSNASPQPDQPVELTYEPVDTVPATRTHQRARPRAGTRVCKCLGVLSNAGIVNDRPHFSETHGCFASYCRLHCHHCGVLIVWTEKSNAEGQLQGQILSGPGYVTDPKTVRRWVANNPIAQELEDVA